MKILLLGNTGQLGWELERTLQPLGKVIALDFPIIDMASEDSIRRIIREHSPAMIINATAYTAVDQAEGNQKLAKAINGFGPGVLAEEARKLNAFLIHYSTDYVFDGKKGVPYSEVDSPNPQNIYGASKLFGEETIREVGGDYLIFRTSWVYSMRTGGFVNKVLEWAKHQETLRIVDDQISNPTWARTLAETTALLLARFGGDSLHLLAERKGLYHLAGGGFTSRLEWAKEILRLYPNSTELKVRKIQPAKTEDFPSPAERPLFSALDCQKFTDTFDLRLPDWGKCLSLAMNPNQNYH